MHPVFFDSSFARSEAISIQRFRPFEWRWSQTSLESIKMSTEKPKREADTLELPTEQSGSLRRPTSSVLVELAGMSHRGHVRANNEDHFLGLRFSRRLETLFTNVSEGLLETSFDETGYGILVADGLGGMAAGEVASRTALCRLVELVVNTPDWIMNLNRGDDVNLVMRRMRQRFRQIDDSLKAQAIREPSHREWDDANCRRESRLRRSDCSHRGLARLPLSRQPTSSADTRSHHGPGND
jgi:hypothetical protein